MRQRTLAFIVLVALALLAPVRSPALDSFSFIHMSDEHVPHEDTARVVRQAGTIDEVELTPYGIRAPKPSFIISTGDCTESGGGKGWWEQYLSMFKEIGLPAYHVAGNHDDTWDSIRPQLTALYGAPYYSFDHGGVHFVGLDSTSPQDPRPGFGREELLWLREDLEKLDAATPIILFYHHPPSREFSSAYDWYRLYDLLRGHNVVAHLVGHGHGIRAFESDIYDCVMGGSTWGGNAGFAICDVREGRLRIAYRKIGAPAAEVDLLDRSLAPAAPYPKLLVTSPKPGAVRDRPVRFEGTMEGEYAKGEVLVDDERSAPLTIGGGRFSGEVAFSPEQAGAHFYRVLLTHADGAQVWRSGDLFADTHPRVRVLWRAMLGGSSKSTPAVLGNRVLVGADDGRLYALDARSGQVRWSVSTGGDILGGPLVLDGKAYVGSGDGKLYEVTDRGKVTRTFDALAPIYSTPAATEDAVLVATSEGTACAVSRRDFRPLWRRSVADYTIEDTLFVAGDVVCFGAWDTFIYALDVHTGQERWKCAASGTREGPAARYYSPADCGPVVCGNRLYIADRKYYLSVVDMASGELVSSREGVVATGLSEDGQAVYLRTAEKGLVKLDSAGKELWTANVPLGYVATAPVERDGVVYSLSSVGTLSAVNAASGEVLWMIRVLPGFYAMADAAAHGGTVYVAGMDGSVTALAPRSP